MHLTTWQAIILGIVQGIGEFLPISSSAHLIIVRDLLGIPDPGLAYDVFLHGATLLATLAVLGYALYIDIKKHPKVLWLILIGIIPAGVIGVLFKDTIENLIRENLLIIALSLIIWSILMLIADERWQDKKMEELSPLGAFVIGIFQAFALIPGTSRSGSTIVGASFMGLSRDEAFRFSFYLSIPTVGGAFLLALKDLVSSGEAITSAFWIGASVSFVVGVISLILLRNIIKKFGLRPFAIYRSALGIFLIVYYFVKMH
ncbi:hypothetical protein GM182_06145 [bacterium 3DAC]|nr:undecaprenyl-diphosphate phosphatase [Dictyoglomota bacterium]UZN23438.1 hypothetical protein GM182_06145 [bacterium 3DAC]